MGVLLKFTKRRVKQLLPHRVKGELNQVLDSEKVTVCGFRGPASKAFVVSLRGPGGWPKSLSRMAVRYQMRRRVVVPCAST
ncbi:hypothetical protein SK128_000379 [Halocaridina rubra]|uniref:Uncharacterized protein n=1 Tax=Halocaridina rubra TaxID=373956 RepID=A0AAN8XEI1_HALRR